MYVLIFIISTVTMLSCKTSSGLNNQTFTLNSKASQEKPYVILVSLDGFRWDYVEQFKPPHLSHFIKNGVKAESLIPSFPSKTFPNHYTIATGMYPENHGLIGNSYFNYEKDVIYSMGNRDMVEDGSYYKGTPIWVLADKSQMVSASYFFVGSEADVQGIRPTYYYRYDGRVKNEDRVDQAVEWLELPSQKRPHMITLYFSDMDDVGHKFSPDDHEKLKDRLFELDKHLGNLFKGVKETGLPVNIIIVSDHGMTTIPQNKFISIVTIKNDDLFLTIDNGAIVNIHPKDATQIDTVYSYLKAKENHFKVYKTEDAPEFEYTPKNKNWGAIQVVPDIGYYFAGQTRIDRMSEYPDAVFGVHGYDPNFKDMHGIFYANGPAFKNRYIIPSVKNIHIYPLICDILGLKIPIDIDGELDKIQTVLKTEE